MDASHASNEATAVTIDTAAPAIVTRSDSSEGGGGAKRQRTDAASPPSSRAAAAAASEATTAAASSAQNIATPAQPHTSVATATTTAGAAAGSSAQRSTAAASLFTPLRPPASVAAAASSSSVSASPTVAAAASLPDIHAPSFTCPLCLKPLQKKTLPPRLLHVASCALANGIDMLTHIRSMIHIQDRAWEEWMETQGLAIKKGSSGAGAKGSPSPSPPPSSAAAKSKSKSSRSKKSSAPLSLDSVLGATKAGAGVGTVMAHIKPPKGTKRGSSSLALNASAVAAAVASGASPFAHRKAAAAASAENAWELSNGVFLLGQEFTVPAPPAPQHSVAQLEKMIDVSSCGPAETSAAAAVSSSAAAASSASSSSASATVVASTSAQLVAWRHYIHEMDSFVKSLLAKRQWALARYRLLQDRLASEGAADAAASLLNLPPVQEGFELEDSIAAELHLQQDEFGRPLSSSLWAKSCAPHSQFPSSPYLADLPLQNRQKPSINSIGSDQTALTVPIAWPAAAAAATLPAATLPAATAATAAAPSGGFNLLAAAAPSPASSAHPLPPAPASSFVKLPPSSTPSGFVMLPPPSSTPSTPSTPAVAAPSGLVPAAAAAAVPTNIWARSVSSPMATPAAAAAAAASQRSSPPSQQMPPLCTPPSGGTPPAQTQTQLPINATYARNMLAAGGGGAHGLSSSLEPGHPQSTQQPPAVAPLTVVEAPTSTSVTPAPCAAASSALPVSLWVPLPPVAAPTHTICMAVQVPSVPVVPVPVPVLARSSLPLPFPLSQESNGEDSLDLNQAAVPAASAMDPASPTSSPSDSCIVLSPRRAPRAAAATAHSSTPAAAGFSSALAMADAAGVPTPLNRSCDERQICIPETPVTSRENTATIASALRAAAATAAQDEEAALEEERKKEAEFGGTVSHDAAAVAAEEDLPAPAVLITAASLFADDNEAMDAPAAALAGSAALAHTDHDSAFSLSQPSIGAASQNSSQPGLERVEVLQQNEHEGQEGAAGERKEQGATHVPAPAPAAVAVAAASAPIPVRASSSSFHVPTRFATATAAASGLVTARAIIELLSDDDEEHEEHKAAPAAAAAASSRGVGVRSMDVEAQNEQCGDDFLLTQLTPPPAAAATTRNLVHSRPRAAAAASASQSAVLGYVSSDDDDSIEDVTDQKLQPASSSRRPFGGSDAPVPSVGSVLAQQAAVPLQWKPASSRKLWGGASSPVTAAAAAAASVVASFAAQTFSALPPVARAPLRAASPHAAAAAAAAVAVEDEVVPRAKKSRKAPAAVAVPASNSAVASPLASASPLSAAAAPLPASSVLCPFSSSLPSSILASFASCACVPCFDDKARFGEDALKDLMAGFGLKAKSRAQMATKLASLWTSMWTKKNGAAAPTASAVPAVAAAAALPAPAAAPAPAAKRKKPSAKAAASAIAAAAVVGSPVAGVALSDITSSHTNANGRAAPSAAAATIAASASVPVAPPAAAAVVGKKTSKRKASDDAPAATASSVPAAAASSSNNADSLTAAGAVADAPTDFSRFPFPPSPFVAADLAETLRQWLRGQHDLFARLLMFQTLDVSELVFCAQNAGIHVNPLQMRSFLDAEGVVTRAGGDQGDEEVAAKPRKGAAHVPRKKGGGRRRG